MEEKIKEFFFYTMAVLWGLADIMDSIGLEAFLLLMSLILLLFYFLWLLFKRLFLFVWHVCIEYLAIYGEINLAWVKRLHYYFVDMDIWGMPFAFIVVFYYAWFPPIFPEVYALIYFPVIANYFFILYKVIIFYARVAKKSSSPGSARERIAGLIIKTEGSLFNRVLKWICFVIWYIASVDFCCLWVYETGGDRFVTVFSAYYVLSLAVLLVDLEFFYGARKRKEEEEKKKEEDLEMEEERLEKRRAVLKKKSEKFKKEKVELKKEIREFDREEEELKKKIVAVKGFLPIKWWLDR